MKSLVLEHWVNIQSSRTEGIKFCIKSFANPIIVTMIITNIANPQITIPSNTFLTEVFNTRYITYSITYFFKIRRFSK